MTFTVSPVNIEIRKNISTEVKEHKVHHKVDVSIDNKMKNPFVKGDKEDNKENKSKKNFFTIDGIKNHDENNVQVEAIKTAEAIVESPTGTFIDNIK
ncbi:MAG: hypothetical protein PUE01_08260 [Clostridiaceae bacterium]|nr:hypothetical protein [Clostridiaceae bacterium]